MEIVYIAKRSENESKSAQTLSWRLDAPHPLRRRRRRAVVPQHEGACQHPSGRALHPGEEIGDISIK